MVTTKKTGVDREIAQTEPTDAKGGITAELRIAREAKGYSFADLHRLTGLSRSTLHQYETGARKPGARELVLLCKALEVSPNRLLLGTEEPFPTSRGVLLPLARLAKTEPEKALSLGLFMLPLVSAILAIIGDDTLTGLATLADESLRARDPETYARLSTLVAEFYAIDRDKLAGKSPEELKELAIQIGQKAGLDTSEMEKKNT